MRFVIRALNAAGELLGWTQVTVHPQAGVFAVPAVSIRAEATGEATRLSIHWTDLDVRRQIGLPGPAPMVEGLTLTFDLEQAPLWEVPTDGHALPSVTVRESVTLSPAPAGSAAHST